MAALVSKKNQEDRKRTGSTQTDQKLPLTPEALCSARRIKSVSPDKSPVKKRKIQITTIVQLRSVALATKAK